MISRVRIGDLGEVITGNTPPRNKPEYYGSHTPFIKATDIDESSKYTYSPEESYSEVGYKKYRKSLIPKGSTCVVTIGSIGKKMTMAHCDCFINQAMNAIIPSADYDPEYVYYVVKNNVHRLKSLDSGTASGRENVSKSAFSNLEIDVIDDIGTQKRIGSVLSNYDDLIENNQKQIKLLEEAAQRLYKEWFVDLRFPGHETTPIVDGVPEGWKQLALEQITPILTGKKDANFSTEDGRYPFFTCAQAPLRAPSYSFDCNAVILAGNGDFNVKLYRGKFEAYQRTYVLSPECTEYLYLLYHAVNNSMVKLSQAASGSTIKFLTKGMIASIPVYTPEVKNLEKFNTLSEAIQKQIEVLKKSIANATEARNRLLPKLMSGEIEV